MTFPPAWNIALASPAAEAGTTLCGVMDEILASQAAVISFSVSTTNRCVCSRAVLAERHTSIVCVVATAAAIATADAITACSQNIVDVES